MSHFTPAVDEPSDITLRSVDGVDYALRKSRLAKYSQVMADMFETATVVDAGAEPVQLGSPCDHSSALDVTLPLFYDPAMHEHLEGRGLPALLLAYEFMVKYEVDARARGPVGSAIIALEPAIDWISRTPAQIQQLASDTLSVPDKTFAEEILLCRYSTALFHFRRQDARRLASERYAKVN